MDPLTNMIECPIDAEWKFHISDLLPLKDSQNGYLIGKSYYAYSIPGVQYYIKIYPNGNCVENRGQTLIFIHVNGSNERNITGNYKIYIKNECNTFNYIFQINTGWGGACAKIEEIFESRKKYFVNGEITIGIKGSLKVARSTITKLSSPISVEWRIKESDLYQKMADILQKDNFGYLRSKRYLISTFSDVKYSLKTYPNGDTVARKGQTWIFLEIEIGKEKKIEAVYDFSIKSANYYCNLQYTFETSTRWGNCCCLKDVLFDKEKRFIVDGYLTINLNGILMVENSKHKFVKLPLGLATPTDQKKKDKEFTIVTRNKKKVMVHKNVLIEASPVFAGMFESGFIEAIENKMDIPDFSFEIVDAAIKLCYSSAVPRKFTIDDMFLLYKFADKYEIKLIMDLVEKYLLEKMSAANVCQFIEFSKEMNITKLYESCIEFLMKCSKTATPVYGANALDKDLLASMFLKSLCPIDETVADN